MTSNVLADDVAASLDEAPTSTPLRKLDTTLGEFATYIGNNAGHIVDYGERLRVGKRYSAGFVESAVNQIVDKRFDKRQSMRWTPRGAHLLLQTRTRVINGDLDQLIRRRYPAFRSPAVGDAAPSWGRLPGRRRGMVRQSHQGMTEGRTPWTRQHTRGHEPPPLKFRDQKPPITHTFPCSGSHALPLPRTQSHAGKHTFSSVDFIDPGERSDTPASVDRQQPHEHLAQEIERPTFDQLFRWLQDRPDHPHECQQIVLCLRLHRAHRLALALLRPDPVG